MSFLKGVEDAVEWLFPTPKTPEQHLSDARTNIKMERRELKSAQTRNKLEQQDAQKAFDRATVKRDRRAAQQQAVALIKLERQATDLDREGDKLTRGENRVNGMVREQVCQHSLITTMQYTNVRAIPLEQARRIAVRYEMRGDVNKMANEAVESALHDSSEELMQEQLREYTPLEERRMHDLMSGYNRSVNQQFIEEMPAIGDRHVSQLMCDPTLLSQSELLRQTQQGTKQLHEFLSVQRERKQQHEEQRKQHL